MKYSKFNTIVDKGEELFIYNSLSGVLMKIRKDKVEKSTDFLIQKGVIVEDNKNEVLLYKYIYYRNLYSNKDIHITIAVTTDCNLRCPYCFEEGNKHKEYINDTIIDSIIKYISVKKERKLQITWFGGEPLLCYDKMIKLNKSLKSNDIKFSASIVTNGTLLNDSNIKNLSDLELDNIQITLDGEREEHNKKRFFPNKKGTFDLIMANIIKILERTNILVILKINIDKSNIVSCQNLINYLNEEYKNYLNSRRLKITSNYIRNRTDFKGSSSCLSEDEYYNIHTQAENKHISIPTLALPCPLRSQNSIIIGPDGSIYKCLEFIGNKSKSIGNIKDFTINLSRLAEYALAYNPFEDEECINCSIFPICGGGCPNDRLRKFQGENISICPSIKKNIPIIIENIFNENNAQIK